MSTIIELQNLTHRYGSLTAVNDVSLQIQEGSVFGFVGPNGAGKTTLLEIVSGHEEADAGQVHLARGISWRRASRADARCDLIGSGISSARNERIPLSVIVRAPGCDPRREPPVSLVKPSPGS